MDAADEKLTAFKKAYADIILSISKEAAARVMASEKKSVRYQHELNVAKEEGVRMLIRLKQMMDFQISEAEAASLIRQKKIEELEAQLQEAEDIVRDLREEMGDLHAELERVKNENSYHVNEASNACPNEVAMENKISSYQSRKYLPPIESSVAFDVTVPYLRQKNECRECHNKMVCTCGTYDVNRDLPSIILRGKDPGLYRNACTQRIRACERNLLDRDLCLLEETDEVKDKTNCREQKEGKRTSKAPAFGAKISTELQKGLLADINLGTCQSFPHKRKRAVRRKKTIIPLGGKQSYTFPKSNQLSEHSGIGELISVNNNAHSAENPPKIGPRLFGYQAETQAKLWSADNQRNIVEIYGAKTMHEDEGENKKAVPLQGATEFSEGLLSRDCKVDVEKVDVPSHSLELNSPDASEGLSSQPARGRVIKYTFQRKRKRQALSGSEVTGSSETEKKTEDGQNGDQKLEQPKPSLLKESSRDHRWCGAEVNGSREAEKKTGEGQDGDQKLEQPKPSLSKESSRDRRRLAQVARQLISLSEKKWWH